MLPNFLIGKDLFDVDMKCRFRGEFYWMMTMMIIVIIQ